MMYVYFIAALLIVLISIKELTSDKKTSNWIWLIIIAATFIVVGIQFHFY